LLGAFKTIAARQINQIGDTPGVTFWQRKFYEHVIRTDADLERIREYFALNPDDGWTTPRTRRKATAPTVQS
jgi:putative transposase